MVLESEMAILEDCWNCSSLCCTATIDATIPAEPAFLPFQQNKSSSQPLRDPGYAVAGPLFELPPPSLFCLFCLLAPFASSLQVVSHETVQVSHVRLIVSCTGCKASQAAPP